MEFSKSSNPFSKNEFQDNVLVIESNDQESCNLEVIELELETLLMLSKW